MFEFTTEGRRAFHEKHRDLLRMRETATTESWGDAFDSEIRPADDGDGFVIRVVRTTYSWRSARARRDRLGSDERERWTTVRVPAEWVRPARPNRIAAFDHVFAVGGQS